MAEFKLSPGFRNEIDAVRNSGQTVNSSASELPSDGVDTLKTSMRYIEQHSSILELMKLYGELLIKDAKDLDEMMMAIQNADTANASGFR